jgi:DNA-binding response OmpR family regulator
MLEPQKRVALLVEDDPAVRRRLLFGLDRLGFEVLAASDYHVAVTLLETRTPHIACVDLTLPRESGLELCEHIRRVSRLSHVPILVLSDRASPLDMAHAEDAGANAYLKKPFSMDAFDKYVITLLDGPHASRPSMRRLRR